MGTYVCQTLCTAGRVDRERAVVVVKRWRRRRVVRAVGASEGTLVGAEICLQLL